ncbi:hypothetical protein GCM10027049_26840 [Mucilaginibacter puniceus]
MTFEEFFKKKRIDLDALEKGNPALFSEFKTHFNQMGEKSFDHTKKYWFNNLRKIYHLAAEIKTEKPKIENQLAEQTVTDTLNEAAEPTPAPKLGFVPKFRAGATKPAAETPAEEKKEDAPAAPKPGFTPRFKAANMAKPADAPAEEKKVEETPAPTTPKPGFTPRFKAGVTKPVEATPAVEDKKEEVAPVEEKPKIGFTPRFKAGVTKPVETAPASEEKKEEETPTPAAPKLGFKPKFKPTTPPKSEGE